MSILDFVKSDEPPREEPTNKVILEVGCVIYHYVRIEGDKHRGVVGEKM